MQSHVYKEGGGRGGIRLLPNTPCISIDGIIIVVPRASSGSCSRHAARTFIAKTRTASGV